MTIICKLGTMIRYIDESDTDVMTVEEIICRPTARDATRDKHAAVVIVMELHYRRLKEAINVQTLHLRPIGYRP